MGVIRKPRFSDGDVEKAMAGFVNSLLGYLRLIISRMHSDPEQTMRDRLLQLRRELEAVAEENEQASEVVVLDQTRVGRLSRMDAMQAQAMSQASGRRRDAMLRKIDAALARIDSDEYGLCHSCEEPIAARRLEVDPTVLLCIVCAEKAEQR